VTNDQPHDQDRAAQFLALHAGPAPLLIPNPWDAGSARILGLLGFQALATTSSGFAATLGKLDGSVTREQVLVHAAAIVAATDLPVSADLENCFAHDPSGVAETVAQAGRVGLAGCSVEDFSGNDSDPIYDLALAAERVAAAAEAAHAGPARMALTARAENHLHGRQDLADTIARLQAFRAAGADVVFAPGIKTPEDIGAVVDSVDAPVSVLALPGGPNVAALASLGVRRISVGGAFAYAALAGLVDAGREFLEAGTLGFWDRSAIGGAAARAAFTR
jgi:2-methylisocitrate lyase-like PEP mutase family enzyme